MKNINKTYGLYILMVIISLFTLPAIARDYSYMDDHVSGGTSSSSAPSSPSQPSSVPQGNSILDSVIDAFVTTGTQSVDESMVRDNESFSGRVYRNTRKDHYEKAPYYRGGYENAPYYGGRYERGHYGEKHRYSYGRDRYDRNHADWDDAKKSKKWEKNRQKELKKRQQQKHKYNNTQKRGYDRDRREGRESRKEWQEERRGC